jgi:hypothetical protein
MTKHYGNLDVGGRGTSTSISGSQLVIDEVTINGTPFDPDTFSADADLTQVESQIASISGDVEQLRIDVDSISISSGGYPIAEYSDRTTDLTIPVNNREVYVGVDTTSGLRTVTMHPNPAAGDKVYVKDEGLNAFTNPITVNGNGNNVDCCATVSINYNNAGVLYIFAGGQWRSLNS